MIANSDEVMKMFYMFYDCGESWPPAESWASLGDWGPLGDRIHKKEVSLG